MDLQHNDFDRILFFEHARKISEAIYIKNPLDADNLTRWAGALLELSQFQNVLESKKMTQDAISKLEEALMINPRKHDALWCLGNALTACGFFTPDQKEARVYFLKASQCFQKALNEVLPLKNLKTYRIVFQLLMCNKYLMLFLQEPGNDLYRKSLEVAAKAPQLHLDLHKRGLGQLGMEAAAGAGTGPSTSIGGKTTKKNKNSDLKYDIFGWILLGVGIFAWLRYAKSHMPPPPLPQ
ncbi:hypothetical protein C1H46_035967 [Malus baccata]|uniref:Mitochondrial import receptor subunit TOM20 n=1 Tax=Malus baccata TaxID=106549 RepID=A0A540KW82_MALBA|nr:hypothetical protein C1H46_035967 [Malus baccata]